MRTILAALALALALVAAPTVQADPASPDPPGAKHRDERFGFAFDPPRGWESMALQTDEVWLAAKYLSDKSYYYTDETGWTYSHKPELLVIAFQHENQKRKKEVVEEEEDGVKVTTTVIDNPYEDYEDFLDRTYAGGGWFVHEKEEDEHDDLKVTKYQIKVEKLARTGPKRILTWVYHTEDIDFAVQIEVLEDEYRKLRRTTRRVHGSFEEIERNGELLPKGGTGDAIRFTRKQLNAGTPEERRTVRMKSQRAMHERAIASLPEGWDHEYHGEVLVLVHEEEKWAERLGEHAELLLEWFEEEFEYFGEGEYVRAPVVRVCNDYDEMAAISRGVVSGTRGGWQWLMPGSEIITCKDEDGWIGWQVERFNTSLLYMWLADRDEDLHSALPRWISIGLDETIGGARGDGRRMEFRIDQWDKDNARLAVSQDRATSPRDIMRMTREEFRSDGAGQSGEAFWSHYVEASMLVRFLLLEEEHRRCRLAKGLLEEYITTLGEVQAEIEEREKDTWANEKTPETEEEEAELARARSERWREREKELMEETFERVFGDWSERDWERFERDFFDWL